MKNFFLKVLTFFGYILPYAAIIYAVLFFLATMGIVENNIKNLSGQLDEIELNQANEYDQALLIEGRLADADILLNNRIDKVKLDNLNANQLVLTTLTDVDKRSVARDQGIVDGVNQLVGDVSYALQKPSYEYLKNITVKLCAKAIDETKLSVGDPHGWVGTGAIIAIDKDFTYILTNRHVMGNYGDGKYKYYVKEGDDKYTVTAIKISKNENVDLALVRINGHIDGKVAVIGFADVKAQDPVFLVGMNLGRPFLYSEGTVSGFDPEDNDELVIGAPIGPGNSGSAVINKDGKLVGLLYAGSIIEQDDYKEVDITHGLCVPIKAIRLFLAGYIEE